jgi:hypothetical protein
LSTVITADRLTLPDEFEGLAEAVIARAQARAEAMLPANIVAHLGQAVAEQTLVSATCHVLEVTRAGTGERPAASVTDWHGSAYGSEVTATLTLMAKPTGRTRAFPIHSAQT